MMGEKKMKGQGQGGGGGGGGVGGVSLYNLLLVLCGLFIGSFLVTFFVFIFGFNCQTASQPDLDEIVRTVEMSLRKEREREEMSRSVDDILVRQQQQQQQQSSLDNNFGREQRNDLVPGKSIPQIKGTSDSSIFVAIASYRDKECAYTLLDMYEKALAPERFRIAIVEHISLDEEKESCWTYLTLGGCSSSQQHTICRYSSNIRILTSDYREGRGPLDARHQVQSLLGNEEFALMLDAHMLFTPHWDRQLMDNWNDLGNEMAIITTYPHGFVVREEGIPTQKTKSVLCSTKFNAELHIPRHEGGHDGSEDGSHITPFWSACISLSKAHAFRAVMFDCCAPFTFEGEEFSYSIRLWTHGYDFYTPRTNIIYHQYFHPGVVDKFVRKKYSDVEWGSKYQRMKGSNERLRRMLRMSPDYSVSNVNLTDIDKYGLGDVRTRDQYIRFSYVDLDSQTTVNRCSEIIRDQLPLVPYVKKPEPKYSGFTIDPHPSLF